MICGMILNDIKKFEPVNTSCDHDQEQYLCIKLKNHLQKTSLSREFERHLYLPSRLMMTNVGRILKESIRTSESELLSQKL